jgi:succinate dehydrogenase flavin-adding protein (antitoxin of CptAB toxin-antitoxin module)
MLNNYKITLIVQNFRIKSENLTASEQKVLQQILDEEDMENINIKITSKRKKGFAYFIDFESTNNLSIQENIYNYYNSDKSDNQKFKKFKEQLIEELDEILTEEDYRLYA